MLRVESRERTARLLDGAQELVRWEGTAPDQVVPGPAGTLLLGGWDELVSLDVERRRATTLESWWPQADVGAARTVELDDGWTVELAGTLAVDGGHTSIGSGSLFVAWRDDGSAPPAEERARLEREERVRLRAEARVPRRRRIRVRRAGVEVVLLEEDASEAQGAVHVMWPPVTSPDGLLLRRARLSDDGERTQHEALDSWCVHPSGAVAT